MVFAIVLTVLTLVLAVLALLLTKLTLAPLLNTNGVCNLTESADTGIESTGTSTDGINIWTDSTDTGIASTGIHTDGIYTWTAITGTSTDGTDFTGPTKGTSLMLMVPALVLPVLIDTWHHPIATRILYVKSHIILEWLRMVSNGKILQWWWYHQN